MSEYIQNGLMYALIGAGVGGTIGLLKVAKDKLMPSPESSSANNSSQEYANYPNILLDPVTLEALSRFQTSYKHLIPREFQIIVENLNKLIGIQVSINSGKIESYYPFRATTYVTQIQTALNSSKYKIRNVSVPHWDSDDATIRQIADDYLYNISQDVNQHMLSTRQ